jgi:DNA-directed RNA polymerase I subunit RPA1
VRSGELLTGVLDKNSLGNTSYGLVHAVCEVYGPEAAGSLLSSMGILLTTYLQMHAQTCGMGDFILQGSAEAQRRALLEAGGAKGLVEMAKACGLGAVGGAGGAGSSSSSSGPGKRALTASAAAAAASAAAAAAAAAAPPSASALRAAVRNKLRGGPAGSDTTGAAAVEAAVFLDNTAKSVNNGAHSDVLKACLPYGLAKPFPSNQFALMVETGSKGSNMNFSMIVVGLGQQELEGRRVPLSPMGKTLPCFPAFDGAARAGGYISDRFLTGLRPADYFFHVRFVWRGRSCVEVWHGAPRPSSQHAHSHTHATTTPPPLYPFLRSA